MWSNRCSP
uniref:Hppd1 n=1 Tax=Arundo donax TaxID=35708 RepID=A0A0A9E086_ARUDO